MPRIYEPSIGEVTAWEQWIAERPENVRAIAEKFNPWTLYEYKETGQRVTLYSFGEAEDGSVTLTVNATGEFNAVLFERQVFGIPPERLEECELPRADDSIGVMLNKEQELDFINA